ncbi:MAG: helix-turn-helix domain-containing protein [Acidimicrobiales bacterium]
MPSTRNSIEDAEPTWVSVEDAAKFAGVSRSTVTRLCTVHGIPVQENGERRRVTRAHLVRHHRQGPPSLTSAPHQSGSPRGRSARGTGMGRLAPPLIERSIAAEQRAVLAEAKLALLGATGD